MSKFHWVTRTFGAFLLWPTAAVALPAQTAAVGSSAPTFTTVLNFDFTDGDGPGGLVQATDGRIYGATSGGGDKICTDKRQNFGCGTFFKITPDGALTTLHKFNRGTQGSSELVQATDGNFYGTTGYSGANLCAIGRRRYGCGTFFRITPDGTLTTLYNFCSQGSSSCTDGKYPAAGLVQAVDGNLYGTTYEGGTNDSGTVFRITPSGALTTLHSFDGKDGVLPAAALVQGTDGNFYGTTFGSGNVDHGTIFKITPSGVLTTLYRFRCNQSGCPAGELPGGALVQGADGDFYGTASYGGADNGQGTIFKITPQGVLTILHTFVGTDGEEPGTGVIQATDGNFYGVTISGGANDCGSIFEITSSGTLTTLYSFCSQFDDADGSNPQAPMIQGIDGKFYGTTAFGGINTACEYGCGIVFNLSAGLGPFVKTLPISGEMGATVRIVGSGLTGATIVIFNGMPAPFTVKSKSEITTTIPTGATTGTVQVILPKGTLSSNVPFTVTP